jgi:predicted nucleotidyltransferase
MNQILSSKKLYCETRIAELRNRIKSISEVQQLKDFCIYATGSYARKEASSHSDLDLFFISSNAQENSISKLSKILVDAELIKMSRNMDFPDFSGDGEYLQIHSLEDLIHQLGSQADDYKNFFTARLLLILESCSLYNDDLYELALTQIIERYYIDFHDHDATFRPIFLTNDIIRFWKTLTINYEHKRNRQPDEVKNKSHVKNLKLKFSRKLTCFSFVLQMLSKKGVISTADIVKIAKLTPIERLEDIGKENPHQQYNINLLLELYAWFLEMTDYKKEELYLWIGDKKNRDEAFNKSRDFANIMYEVMKNIDNNDLLKYLII